MDIVIIILVFILFLCASKKKEGFRGRRFHTTKESLRKLFSERAMWMKIFIEDNLQDKSDKLHIQARLYKNTADVKKYMLKVSKKKNVVYKFARMLKKRSDLLISMIYQIQTQNKSDIIVSIDAVNQHSDMLAKFMANHSKGTLTPQKIRHHLTKQNKYIYNMTNTHFIADHASEVSEYDRFYTHMLKLSDLLNIIIHT